MSWPLLALALLGPAPIASAQGQAPEAPDSDRERQIMERFRAVLEKNPRRGTALDRVYGFHVERGTLDPFIKTYQDRVAKDPKDADGWLLLGLFEAQRGRDAAAVAAFRKAEETRPGDALPSYYLGQALVLVGQPEAAADAFERALKRKPARGDLLEIFQALGRVHQRAHHADKALAVWNRLESIFPDDLRVQEQIAAALAEESQPEQALPRYEALAKKATDQYRQVQFRIDAAELKVRLGKVKEALADFEGLLGRLNPESWLYRDVRRKVEDVFLRNDDQTGLAKYYEAWIAKNPEDVEAMARLGRSLANLGRIPEARSWLEKAVKRAPSRKELRLALVEQLVQEKKYAEAAAQYEAMAKSDPNNPDLLRDWGRMLLRVEGRSEAERKQAAADVWRRLVDARPRDPAAAVQAADLFRQAEMPAEAIDLYKKAIALAPDAPQYYEYLGEYYHSLKKSTEALATWGKLAEGKNRNAKNLARLAEVLAGFGYKKEALGPIAEASRLEDDAFEYQIKYADLLVQSEKYDDSLKQLDVAAKVADDPEQAEAVLGLQIKAYQASDKLAGQIESLRKELEAGKGVDAARWRRLARLLEADQKMPEALAAIRQAVKLGEKSVPSRIALARISEQSGDLGGAALAYRDLARIDRRALTEYMTQVAKLEMRLGRREKALEAGRAVLDAAPGNPENYEFFADLCSQLGATEEGLDALRRAVRVNPADTKALLTLAEALAKEFRTEEAIELFWRAFDKAADLEGKLGIVARLADLYLQRNQFDRLISRLEREGREAKQPRESAIILAQAYQSSGDLATARQELERLLAASPRDAQLLQQLSGLAESDGDIEAASKYQKQLNELSPSDEGAARLANLYLRSGEGTEAEAIWAKMAGGKQEPERVLQSIDHLLKMTRSETVLGIIERALRDRPGDWELLYREGIALAALEKPDEAARRFVAILGARGQDDDEGEQAKAARKRSNPGGRAVGSRMRQPQPWMVTWMTGQENHLQNRVNQVWQVRQATGLDAQQGYYYGQQQAVWSPGDFGQARLAALAWLLHFAEKAGKQDDWLKEQRAARDRAPKDLRRLRDWYYLCVIRQEPAETFEAARELARVGGNDPENLHAFLASLANRGAAPGRQIYVNNDQGTVDRTPPLPPAEVAEVMDAFKELRARKPDWADITMVSAVSTELDRAHRKDEAEAFYKAEIADDRTPGALSTAIALASQKGDVATFLKLIDRYDAMTANGKAGPFVGGLGQFNGSMAQLIGARADAKAHADALKIVDHYLDWHARPDQVKARARAQATGAINQGQNYVMIRVGKNNNRYIQIDFPNPNRHLDQPAIQLLRTTFEVFKRDDLLSDLFDHLRKRSEAAPAAEKITGLLALGALHWWNDEKDEAVRAMARAADAPEADAELRLALAEVRGRRGEHDEALALVDAVEPLDQKTMQRREILALRMAVLAGNVERARKAAERLFNLRLDTETQIQLAGQMHQLGMHDLAEAVLARARHRAGNNANSLVALMRQYQQQDKPEIAVQVAHKILGRSPARTSRPYRDQDDVAREEAIQVLARSGKLQDLIGRVEAQLKTSPNSTQLLRTLAEYHKAAGAKDKAIAVYERMAGLHPEDASLQYQIAQELVHSGDAARAIPHYRDAIKKDPSLFANRYWEVQNTFQQAGKLDELAGLFNEIDLSKMGNYWTVSNLVSQLMQDAKTRPRGLELFRKMWKAYPNERPNILGNLYNDEVWKLPEMYDYAREAVIPAATQKRLEPWAGIDNIQSWSGGGRVNGVTTRLLEAATKQNKLDTLAVEVESTLKAVPEWQGGKALLAIIRAKRGRFDEAKKALEEIVHEDEKSPIPHNAKNVIGQELEDFGPLRPLVMTLYERANKEDDQVNGLDFEFHPVRRLVEMYRKAGRTAEARDLVLKFAKRGDSNGYDPQYAAYRRIEQAISIGRALLEMGFPADAVAIYNGALSDTETLQTSSRFGNQDYQMRQLRDGLNQSLRGLKPETLAQTLRTLVKPNDADGPAVNLVLIVYPRALDQAGIRSLFAEVVHASASRPDLRRELDAALAKLAADRPNDFSVQVALALVGAEEGPEALATAARRLEALAEERPLEDLSADARANARQRAEAERRIPLWLVARACEKHDATREPGRRLDAIALEAARRMADPIWSLAMLRQSGQVALDRGDRATADRAWSQMLDLVLAGGRPTPTIAAARPGKGQGPATPATTLDRFEMAAQLARLAASHDMIPLSLRAIRTALAGGPPVIPMPLENNNGGMMVTRSSRDDSQNDQTALKVEEYLAELNRQWTRQGAPAAEVFAILQGAVLPESRPEEVFLYPRPLSYGVLYPRCVGMLLADWAVRAGKADELRKALDARGSKPKAAIPALVVRTRLALALKDDEAAASALKEINERLKKDTLQTSAELACHAALPALDEPAAAVAAVPVIEKAIKGLSGSGQEPQAGLLLALAHHNFRTGKAELGRKQVREYQAVLERNFPNYGGDYGLYARKQNLQRVAAEFARAGQWADTLDVLGQFVDAPAYSGGDPALGNVITRLATQLARQPARERFERLRDWSLPTPNRRSIRLLASFVPEDRPPSAFGEFPTEDFEVGLASTAGMLIRAARDAGTLDGLAAVAEKLDAEKVENAEALLALIRIAQGRGAVLRDRLALQAAAMASESRNDQGRNRAIRWDEYLLMHAALDDPALRGPVGEPMAEAIVERGRHTQSVNFQNHARRDLNAARTADAGAATTTDAGLALWHPAEALSAHTHAAGAVPAWWAEHEGIIEHVTGSDDDYLFFDYPLAGRFEFSADVYVGGWSEGQLAYGGLVFEACANGVPSGVFPAGRHERVPLPSKFARHESFNRMTVQVEPGKVRALVNGHLFYEDEDPSPTSPWLALFCSAGRQSAYRDLTIKGEPIIPREVALTHGDRLEGWVANFWNESQPRRRSIGEDESAPNPDAADWSARDGEIRGRRGETLTGGEPVQGRLYYVRPLRDGDSIRHEFYYEPGAIMSHPTLGRLAFLLEPEGVRLHWITDGRDDEWTGLRTDNVADEPADRRGPARLPLKEKDWNALTITLKGDVAAIELNGTRIYERPLEPSIGRQFGLFHDKDRTAVRVRNVVLKGNWPESLTPRQITALAGRREADREARHAPADSLVIPAR